MKKCPTCATRYNDDLQFCPNDGSRLVAEQRTFTLAGQVFNNRYQVIEELDSSGLWDVCLANDILANYQPVVIKLLKLKQERLAQYQAKIEFRLHHLSTMHHPGILKILHYGFHQDCFYVVSEFASGKDLKKLFKEKGFLHPSEAIPILTQVISIVQYLHTHQLLHLELSLSKIFLIKNPTTLDCVKIDAIGQLIPESITNIGEYVRENSRYQAPELWITKTPDVRCDIFSIGVIGYELLTGVFPFPPSTSLVQYAKPVIPPLTVVNPNLDIPYSIEKAIYKAIQYNPHHRFHQLQNFYDTITKSNSKTKRKKLHIWRMLLPLAIMGILLSLILVSTYISELRMWWSREQLNYKMPLLQITSPEIISQIPAATLTKRRKNEDVLKKMKEIQQQAKEPDNDDVCLIPEGTILLPDNKNIMRIVPVPLFYIDRMEVTNLQYSEFVNAVGYTPPPYWQNNTFPVHQDNHPVVMVNWYDASYYAAWRKKQLPTEAQWQRAAQGDAVKIWPWGNSYVQGFANAKSDHALPVGSFVHAKSQFGVQDMAGNVWEWTDTWYQNNNQDKIIRGGSFRCHPEQTTTYYRDGFLPEHCRDDIGFRCVKN